MITLDLTRPARWRALAVALLGTLLVWANVREAEVIEHYPPGIPAAARGRLVPLYQIDTAERKLALTFDISWGTQRNGPVLDVLKRYGVKATFFLSGPWARRYPEVVRRIAAEGHEVESHGHQHVDFSGLGRDQVVDNIRSAHAILKELTGRDPRFIRPPNGDFNDQSIEVGRELGYETVIWSADSIDWKNPGVDVITNRVLKLAHPGAIVLLHASDSCKQTDQALPAILEGLQAKGYQFVLLEDLVKLGPPSVPTAVPEEE